jgi:hypothetical protein
MASHVMSNDTAKKAFVSIQEEAAGENVMGTAETLTEAFSSINQQLTAGFGLEIVTLVDRTEDKAVKYHAIINTQCDDIAKQHSFEKAYTAHERAFVRLMMQRFVEQDTLKRKDCINLRSELDHGFKLKLEDAERLIQLLLDEKWLRVSTRSQQDENDDEEEEDEDLEGGGRSQRRRQSQKKRHRRESVQNELELAPRAYMELSHYLSNLGLDPEDMPQILFHRR